MWLPFIFQTNFIKIFLCECQFFKKKRRKREPARKKGNFSLHLLFVSGESFAFLCPLWNVINESQMSLCSFLLIFDIHCASKRLYLLSDVNLWQFFIISASFFSSIRPTIHILKLNWISLHNENCSRIHFPLFSFGENELIVSFEIK